MRADAERKALEARFDGDMVDIYRRTGAEFGYWPTRFLQLVRRVGGVAAARKLLSDRSVSDGFLRLLKHRRLDLSVEYLVTRPRYAELFSQEERQIAADRLRTYGFEIHGA